MKRKSQNFLNKTFLPPFHRDGAAPGGSEVPGDHPGAALPDLLAQHGEYCTGDTLGRLISEASVAMGYR